MLYENYDSSGLTSIEIPNSVTSIGSGAFNHCSSLTSIMVEPDNAKYDSRNNYNAIIETATNTLIAGCKNTIIPNSVTCIGNYAFSGCSGLTSITIPNSVTSIGSEAFCDCSSLTSIEIPNSVTSIGDEAFRNCSGLTSITIPNSVTSIGDGAFRNCSGLTSITIPNSVTSIGDFAFSYCSGLTSITIPNSVTSIGIYAFEGCSGLTSITIPNSVTSIGDGAFWNCSNLIEIYVSWNKPISIYKSVFDYDASGKILIALYVPQGRTKIYQAASVWQDFYDVLEYDATGVGEVHVSSDVKVRASGNVITVSGAEEDDLVEVYSFSGALMKRDRGNARIILDAEGVYIVKVGNDSFKVRL